MKKFVYLVVLVFMVLSCCNSNEVQTVKRYKVDWYRRYDVLVIDSCEYLVRVGDGDITHKGNCRFCEERNGKKEGAGNHEN